MMSHAVCRDVCPVQLSRSPRSLALASIPHQFALVVHSPRQPLQSRLLRYRIISWLMFTPASARA